jgi:hypothetical protein
MVVAVWPLIDRLVPHDLDRLQTDRAGPLGFLRPEHGAVIGRQGKPRLGRTLLQRLSPFGGLIATMPV